MDIYTQFVWNKNLGFFGLIWYILLVIGLWNTFEKAGEAGWKALIPIYNFYILFKIAQVSPLFWLAAGCLALAALSYALAKILFIFYPVGWILSIGAMIIQLMMWYRLSVLFGHGMGYALGLWILNPIFIMILGFGSSRYMGRRYY